MNAEYRDGAKRWNATTAAASTRSAGPPLALRALSGDAGVVGVEEVYDGRMDTSGHLRPGEQNIEADVEDENRAVVELERLPATGTLTRGDGSGARDGVSGGAQSGLVRCLARELENEGTVGRDSGADPVGIGLLGAVFVQEAAWPWRRLGRESSEWLTGSCTALQPGRWGQATAGSVSISRIRPMLVARSALSGIAGHYSGHPLRTRSVLADAAGTVRAVFLWSVEGLLFRDNQGENVATIKMRKPMLRAWGGRA